MVESEEYPFFNKYHNYYFRVQLKNLERERERVQRVQRELKRKLKHVQKYL
jgi:hypothetical protein